MTQLLQNSLYGAILILAAAALRRGMRGRLAPEARLVLWGACLARLLTPAAPESVLSLWGLFAKPPPAPGPAATPALPQPSPQPVPLPTVQPVPLPTQAPQVSVSPPPVFVPVPAPASQPAFPWEMVLTAAWFAAALALAAWYVRGWRCTRRAVAAAIPVGRPDPRYALLPRCARLREGPMAGAPLTFGVARPTVVLPPGLSGTALECVLVHEGVHARRRDNLWHYLMALALVVHWWNPAVWLMSRLLRQDIELACDRAAVRRLGMDRRADYAKTLIALSTQGEGPAFSRAFGHKLTEERILAIMNYKKLTALGLALTILLVGGVTVAFATDPVTPQPDPAPAVTEAVEETQPLESVAPALTEEELLVQKAEQMLEEMHMALREAGCDEVYPVAQANCEHPRLSSGEYVITVRYSDPTETVHTKFRVSAQKCPDCGTEVFKATDIEEVQEAHSFGAGRFISSNHASPDPSSHTYTYSHTCVYCNNSYQYTVPSGCREGNCVDPYSLTPEDESQPLESVAPALTEDAQMREELHEILNDMAKTTYAIFNGALNDEDIFVQSIVSDLTEEEEKQLKPILDEITKNTASHIQELSEMEALLTGQSDCPHIHTTPRGINTSVVPLDEATHTVTVDVYQRCNDCSKIFIASRTVSREPHNFGAGRFISSNHASLDPSSHTYTYSHTCEGCNLSRQYTVPSGCRKGNCIDPYSLTPEAEVQGAPADAALCDGTDCGLEGCTVDYLHSHSSYHEISSAPGTDRGRF